MKFYYLAKSPNGDFVGSFTFAAIRAGLQTGAVEIGDYVTESFGPPYAKLIKMPDIQWQTVSELMQSSPEGAEEAVPGQVALDPRASQPSSNPMTARYTDAYRVSNMITALGATVKIIGIAVIVGAAFVGVLLLSSSRQSAILCLALAVVAGVPIYILGILTAAQGQILKATLDTAVNTSPLLTREEQRQIMS